MKRVYYLDVTKVVGIILVVFVAHAKTFMNDKLSIIYHLYDIVGTLGVPLFVLVSGALILNKTSLTNWKGVKFFYLHNLITIWVTAEIWIVVFYLITSNNYSIKELSMNMLLINKPADHLWYIRMIVTYYFVLPAISYLLRSKNTEYLLWMISLLVLCFTFFFNGYHMLFNNGLVSSPKLSYFCYLIYFLLGYFISNRYFKKIPLWAIVVLFILPLLFLYFYLGQENIFLWYDNPLILLSSIGLFELLRRTTIDNEDAKRKKFVITLSKMSFGIYLSHFLILEVIRKMNLFYKDWSDVSIFLITGFASFIFSILLMKICGVSKLLSRALFRF